MSEPEANGTEAHGAIASRPDNRESPSDEVAIKLEDKRRQFRRARSHSRRILQRNWSVSSQNGRLGSSSSVFGPDIHEVNVSCFEV